MMAFLMGLVYLVVVAVSFYCVALYIMLARRGIIALDLYIAKAKAESASKKSAENE